MLRRSPRMSLGASGAFPPMLLGCSSTSPFEGESVLEESGRLRAERFIAKNKVEMKKHISYSRAQLEFNDK